MFFAIRVFESKKEAYTEILQEVSGFHSALRSIIGGAPLLRVQVNTLLLSDIALTMKIGRNILQQSYSLKENEHSSVFKELENIFVMILEYFLAPMSAAAGRQGQLLVKSAT